MYFHDADDREIIKRSFEVSALTHAHIRSQLCCAYYSLLVSHMPAGASLPAAMRSASKAIEPHLPDSEREHLARILTGSVVHAAEQNISGSGYVVHCLEAALWCVHHYPRFEDAVLAAVNLGEDTDTTAAVTGGLAGVRDGMCAIPSDWRYTLARIDEIHSLVSAFADVVCGRSSTKVTSADRTCQS